MTRSEMVRSDRARLVGVAALVVMAVVVAACAGPPAPASTSAPASAPVPVSASAEEAGSTDAVLTPIVGAVPYAPVPVTGEDGRVHLVYEISVINYTDGAVTLDRVEVLDPATGATVDTLAGADLGARVKPTGGTVYSAQLQAGQNAMVFLHVTLDAHTPVPATLTHALTATIGGNRVTERLATTAVNHRVLPVLGPPLAGQGIVAADGCCDAVRHTRAVLPLNGAPELAQRFAIDYEQIGPDQRIFSGPKTDLHSYRIFGANVLAVADATVADTHDGLPEQVPGTYPADIPITQADGNFVVLDLGSGFFVNYAHLQPGSVRVQPGQRVHRGDVLGLVGNTGNSIAPHLHLHLMDNPSPVVSQGLPYLIDSFTVTGRVASTADFDQAEADGTPVKTVPGLQPTEHRDQLVLDQAIVTFTTR